MILKIALMLGYKPIREWLSNRALVLPMLKRNELATKLKVSPLVVAAIEEELRKQVLASLDKEARKVK